MIFSSAALAREAPESSKTTPGKYDSILRKQQIRECLRNDDEARAVQWRDSFLFDSDLFASSTRSDG